MLRQFQAGRMRAGERGFSIIELTIAMLIALFLLGGLLTLVAGTRRSSATQSAVSQLQDNQRIAMTLISNIVQKAGYFPNPVSQDLNTFLAEAPLAGVSLTAQQVLGGTPGDTLAVRFFAPPSDSGPNPVIMDCAGQSNASASTGVWYTNAFSIGTVNGTSWLQCQTRTSGTGAVLTMNLIPNVTQMTVMFGVASNSAGDDASVVQYLTTSQMTATAWLNVTTVKVTLTFQQPVYGTTGGQMSATQTSTFTRVIPIMSRAGVDT